MPLVKEADIEGNFTCFVSFFHCRQERIYTEQLRVWGPAWRDRSLWRSGCSTMLEFKQVSSFGVGLRNIFMFPSLAKAFHRLSSHFQCVGSSVLCSGVVHQTTNWAEFVHLRARYVAHSSGNQLSMTIIHPITTLKYADDTTLYTPLRKDSVTIYAKPQTTSESCHIRCRVVP